MRRRSESPVFIKLTPLQINKIEVMKESIIEPVTRKDILDGLIDGGYLVAIKTLHDEGRISKRDYQDFLKFAPDYLKGDI